MKKQYCKVVMAMLSIIGIFIYGTSHISADRATDSEEVFVGNNVTSTSSIISQSSLDSRNYISTIQVTIKNVSQFTISKGYIYLPFAADNMSNRSAPVKWNSIKNSFVYPAGYSQPTGTELSITNSQVSNKAATLEYTPRGSITRYLTQNNITYLPSDTVPRIYFGSLEPGSSIIVDYTVHLTSPEGTNVNTVYAINRSVRATYKQAYITSLYKDTQGNEIGDATKELKYVGDTYSTVNKDLSGYTFKHVDGDFTGQVSEEGQTVTYVYTKDIVPGGDVTANYVDENGKTISDQVVKSGNVGDEYSTEQKNIDGYTFKEVQGNATGTFTADGQTVSYVYTKNPVVGGDVTANYVDENGKTISDQVVKSGNIGDEYSTEQKNIDGYTFKEVQGNATGTFTADSQTVTYVYTKNPKAPEKPVTPDSPEKPVIPDNGKTGSKTNNNTTVNNTTTNNVVKTVKKSAEKMLPKTAAEKVGFSAILAIILAGVTGVVVFKSRRNKQ